MAASPYEVTVVPGRPSAKRTVISGPGRRGSIVGSKACFEVEARDAHGNRWFIFYHQQTMQWTLMQGLLSVPSGFSVR